MKKKIAIQTHPLKTNYGGILQAFALQYYLNWLGYDVEHLQRVFTADDWLSRLKQFGYRIVYFREQNVKKRAESVFEDFIKRNIHLSPELKNSKEWIKYIKENQFDGVITGSDQVWRKEYTGAYLNEYFLNFPKGEKKIAYAASFGVDSIDDDYASKIGGLLRDFDAISVREDSGVKILKDIFNLDAVHLPDPTLLLTAKEYIDIFKLKKEKSEPFLFAYVLDKDKEKQKVIFSVEETLGVKTRFVYGSEITKNTWHDKDITKKVSIEKWLQNFYNADFIVTDSFHGTVFSIIFNKPFVAIGNTYRGLSRFDSLLKRFDLTERLIKQDEELPESLIYDNIDYHTVNKRLTLEQGKAFTFIKTAIEYE